MKAVIEGVCLHMRWLLETSEKKVRTAPAVRFSGGSAMSKTICQILADVLGREVETIEDPRHVGTLGAAALAAVSLGVVDDIKDVRRLIRVGARFTPNPENTAVYNRIYPVFQQLYFDNKKSFAALNDAAPAKRPTAAR